MTGSQIIIESFDWILDVIFLAYTMLDMLVILVI